MTYVQMSGIINTARNPDVLWVAKRTSARIDGKELLRVKDRLVAFPSNASMGEFGFAVQLDLSPRVLGVATW